MYVTMDKTHGINVRVDKETYKKVKYEAERLQRSVTQQVRLWIAAKCVMIPKQ